MKKMGLMLMISIFLSGLIPVWSEEGKGGEGEIQKAERDAKKMEMLIKELNLSEEQAANLKKVKTEQRQKMRDLRKAMQEKRQQLREVLQKSDTTRESVNPYVLEMKDIQSRMIDERINGIFVAKELLSPEQFVKFQKVTEEWRGKHKGKFRERRENRGKGQTPESSGK